MYGKVKKVDFLVKNDDNISELLCRKGLRGGGYLKVLLLTALLASIVLFQNCGETARNTTILADDYLASSGCNGLDCNAPEELLWVQIREYEPYKVQIATLEGHFTVGGQCGTGTFSSHSFLWELREGFGRQQVIAAGFSDSRCYLGQFQVPIIFNGLPPTADQRYQLTMEIVGIGAGGEQVSNPLPASNASLDVIFTTDPP